ncbi:MAG: hypothetical protein EHM38_03375 [Geobacteraceae bacterium]|nr:MAG: hypothetical protein EHM38_03375 [Geobacteraceae bacterium]
MSQDPVLQPLYRLDKFLRFELTQTFTSKQLLEPAKDWSIVTESYHQLLVEQRTNLPREELKHLESTFAELERNLNAVAEVFREIALVRGTPKFDEKRYLNQANAAIDRVRRAFQAKLSEFEMLHRKPLDVGSKTLTDRMIDGLKNHPLIAIIVTIGFIIIGIGTVTDSIDKTLKFFTNPPEAHTPPPAVSQSPSKSQHSEGTNSPNIMGDRNLVIINPKNDAKPVERAHFAFTRISYNTQAPPIWPVVGKPLAMSFYYKNVGDGTAHNTIVESYAVLKNDDSLISQQQAVTEFHEQLKKRIWNEGWSQAKEHELWSTTKGGAIISAEDRDNILSGKRTVFLIGLIEFMDDFGKHSQQFCWLLQPSSSSKDGNRLKNAIPGGCNIHNREVNEWVIPRAK